MSLIVVVILGFTAFIVIFSPLLTDVSSSPEPFVTVTVILPLNAPSGVPVIVHSSPVAFVV